MKRQSYRTVMQLRTIRGVFVEAIHWWSGRRDLCIYGVTFRDLSPADYAFIMGGGL